MKQAGYESLAKFHQPFTAKQEDSKSVNGDASKTQYGMWMQTHDITCIALLVGIASRLDALPEPMT